MLIKNTLNAIEFRLQYLFIFFCRFRDNLLCQPEDNLLDEYRSCCQVLCQKNLIVLTLMDRKRMLMIHFLRTWNCKASVTFLRICQHYNAIASRPIWLITVL